MFCRSVAILAVAASAVVAKEYAIQLGPVDGALVINDKSIKAGVDVADLLKTGVDLKIPELGLTLPISSLPALPTRHRHRRAADASPLPGIQSIFSDLEGKLAPELSSVTSLLQDLSNPEQLVSDVESKLGSVTSLLQGALPGLQGLTGTVNTATSEVAGVTKEVAAKTVSGVYSDIASTLSEVKNVEGDVPVVGPMLQSATSEIQTALASLMGEVNNVAGPVVATAETLLAPVSGLLSEVGLGSITSLLDGVLRQ